MNLGKFKALVHYVIATCNDPKSLGATKLNKVLWYVDSIAYKADGESLTGMKYLKRQYGPVPDRILQALRELEAEGAIEVGTERHFGTEMKMLRSKSSPESNVFSRSEIELVGEVIEAICYNHTAKSISDLSHDQIWQAANIGEEIPMFATLAANPGEISQQVMIWADSVVERVEKSHQ